jgi:O-antigen/teichoic acid export membrane protein
VVSSIVANVVNVSAVGATLLLGWGLAGLAGSLLASRVVDLAIRGLIYRASFLRRLPAEARTATLPPELRSRMVRFCWHQTVLLVLQAVIWDRSEIFFLGRYSRSDQIAFYSLSFNTVQYVLVLPTILAWSTGTTLMVEQGRNPDNVRRIAGTALWLTCLVAIPCTFGLAAVADPLVRVMFGERYVPAIPVLEVLATLGVFKALLGPSEQLLVATENQGFFIRWNVVMIGVYAGLTLALVPALAAMGAAYSRSLTHAGGAAGLLVFAWTRLGVRLSGARLLKLVFLSTLMMVAVSAISRTFAPGPALALGVPVGVALVLVQLKLLRVLDEPDRQRLLEIGRTVPSRLRPAFGALVRFVAPA